ncbi:hypothetical protein H8D30_05985 [bacterium]|nr:hypothetical protein [bacterium]
MRQYQVAVMVILAGWIVACSGGGANPSLGEGPSGGGEGDGAVSFPGVGEPVDEMSPGCDNCDVTVEGQTITSFSIKSPEWQDVQTTEWIVHFTRL